MFLIDNASDFSSYNLNSSSNDTLETLIFLQTPVAHVIAGTFAIAAIIITVYQV